VFKEHVELILWSNKYDQTITVGIVVFENNTWIDIIQSKNLETCDALNKITIPKEIILDRFILPWPKESVESAQNNFKN
jgi:hypothetical protein